jgi:integrase
MSAHRFTLFKHSNGRYYVLFYDEHGRRKWKSTGHTTKPEALKALTEFRELVQRRTPSLSLKEFFSQFIAYAETVYRPKTLELMRNVIKGFEGMHPRAYLAELTPQHVDAYKAKRLREVSPVTVHIELRTLRSVFNVARRWKMLETDPCDGVSLPQLPERAPLALTREDIEKLISCIRENWLRELVIFAVQTGMRRGELLNLKWSSVDFEGRLVTVETSASFRTKAGRRRVVPLSDSALHLLRSKYGKSPSEFVFTLNDRPIYPNWVRALFKRYVRKANLSNPQFRFHSLRHTFASWLVQKGVPIYEVQKILGHSSVNVTEVYSHLAGSELHSAVNRISIPLN